MKTKTLLLIMLITMSAAIFTACTSQPVYQTIAPAEAQKLLQSDSSVILLDVRTPAEYEEVHIPGSTLLPIDDISTKAETLLPDKNATILVYCRSGNRSQAASRQLLEMGYTSVYDLGGIKNWPYETEAGK